MNSHSSVADTVSLLKKRFFNGVSWSDWSVVPSKIVEQRGTELMDGGCYNIVLRSRQELKKGSRTYTRESMIARYSSLHRWDEKPQRVYTVCMRETLYNEDLLVVRYNETDPSSWSTRINDKLHSIGDAPAIVSHGEAFWYRDGILHRDNDLPAVVRDSVDLFDLSAEFQYEWWFEGKRHRQNSSLPAAIGFFGSQVYYQHGKIHNDTGRPAIVIHPHDKKAVFKAVEYLDEYAPEPTKVWAIDHHYYFQEDKYKQALKERNL